MKLTKAQEKLLNTRKPYTPSYYPPPDQYTYKEITWAENELELDLQDLAKKGIQRIRITAGGDCIYVYNHTLKSEKEIAADKAEIEKRNKEIDAKYKRELAGYEKLITSPAYLEALRLDLEIQEKALQVQLATLEERKQTQETLLKKQLLDLEKKKSKVRTND